jgi:hypothetical protein
MPSASDHPKLCRTLSQPITSSTSVSSFCTAIIEIHSPKKGGGAEEVGQKCQDNAETGENAMENDGLKMSGELIIILFHWQHSHFQIRPRFNNKSRALLRPSFSKKDSKICKIRRMIR